MNELDQKLEELQAQRDKEKSEYYAASSKRRSIYGGADDVVLKNQHHRRVYDAMQSMWRVERAPVRRQGFMTRLFRLIKGMIKARRDMKGKHYFTAEKKRAAYWMVFEETCTPVADAMKEVVETAWDFIREFSIDLKRVVYWILDAIIVAAYYLGSFLEFLWDRFWDFRYWVEARKGRLFRWFTTILALVVFMVIMNTSTTAYAYSYYGKTLGITKSKDDVYRTIEVLGDKLSEASGTNISLDVERDIEFSKVRGFGLDVDSDDDILNTLTYMKDLQVIAYSINVNDKPTVILESEDVAKTVIQAVKDNYSPSEENVEYESVLFVENVEISEQTVQLGDIWNPELAARYLISGTLSDVDHKIMPGESLADIAAGYGISESQLLVANPEIDPDHLAVGTTITLGTSQPIISVSTVEKATYYEDIEFGVQYINNASLYKGETELKSDGAYGQKQVIAQVVRLNGAEQSREVLDTSRVKDPVDAVMYRGTKDIPPSIGTGTFIIPLLSSYRVSSEVGPRWGRNHNGMDLAIPTGTKVYASDGGVVTYSGWKGELGYCVIIDHGGLYTTTYGHNSKLLVSVGDKIYQGQNIALSGNTGKSTGPHLHFEMRYNGDVVNPRTKVDFSSK